MAGEFVPVTKEELAVIKEMADLASKSSFFKGLSGGRGQQAGIGEIFAIMMYARGLKLDPWECLFGGMNCISGRVQVSPVMMGALARRAGHKIEIIRHDESICKLKGTRSDTGDTVTVSFSIDDAKRAGIYNANSPWGKYPADMLWARAISQLCRRLCPDAIGPSYVEGEISGDDSHVDVPSIRKAVSEMPVVEHQPEIVHEVPEPEKKVEFQPLSDEEIDELCTAVMDTVDLPRPEMVRDYVLHLQCICIQRGISVLTAPAQIARDPKNFVERYNRWVEQKDKIVSIA